MIQPDTLIVGGTGTVGRHVAALLADYGVAARALVRDTARAAALLPAGIELRRGDLGSAPTLDEALVGIGCMFLVGANGPRQADHEVAAIHAAARAGVRHVVRLSSWTAAHDPAHLHRQIELQLEASGLMYTHLRPMSFTQTSLTLVERDLRESDAIFLPAGDGCSCFVDVRDIAAAAVKALMGELDAGRGYVLRGTEPSSYAEVAEAISQALGRTIVYRDVSPDEAERRWLAHGFHPQLVAILVREFVQLAAASLSEVRARVLGLGNDLPSVLGRPPYGVSATARDVLRDGEPATEWRDLKFRARLPAKDSLST